MIDVILRYTLPAAYAVLPKEMHSAEATAFLLAIGLQESRFLERRQLRGPARGFWQFEREGVRAVLEHDRTHLAIAKALHELRYDHTIEPEPIHEALEHNDVLAACFARCLLWASPLRLPGAADRGIAWNTYLSTWRPGKPREESWSSLYLEAWDRTRDLPSRSLEV